MKMRTGLQWAIRAIFASALASTVWAQPSVPPWIAMSGAATGMSEARWLTYGYGGFVVTGFYLYAPPGGTTATAPDSFHWTVHRKTNSVIVGISSGVFAGNSNFVVVGDSATYYGDPAGTNGLIQFSPDGIAWDQPMLITSVPLYGVVYAKGVYVAVGQSGTNATIVTSSDGVHWSTHKFPGYGPLHSITIGGGTFVAVGDSGTILTSSNGSDWLAQVLPPGTDIFSIAYGNGMFVAAAFPYGLTSMDGTNWMILQYSPVGGIAYGNGLFVSISQNIDVSTNGVDWIRIWTHGGALVFFADVVYGAGLFNILVGEGAGGVITIGPRAFLGWSVETNGVLDLTLTGGWLGQSCRLQAATNLPASDWVDLFTFTNQGSVTHLQDPGATNYSQRFYRVAMP
jgi:hypothetical protein